MDKGKEKQEQKYCPVCRESLELVLPNAIMGVDFKVRRMCACERAKEEQQRLEREQRQRSMELERNRSVCFHDKRMLDWNFAHDNGRTPAMEKAKLYVGHWDDVRKNGAGLLLWGGIGSGKTYLAACIANALLEQGKKVLMTDFVSITNISMYDIQEYVQSLSTYDLLIIDDLGAERKTEYAVQNIFDVVNRRWESGKPLIVTTNLSLEDIHQETDLAKGRIYDRLLDMCTPVMVIGESKRVEYAEKKKDFFKGIFTTEEGVKN